ncbi:hypothetical protein Kisp02_47330 [Kineosporia sp. NBRC 101731]|nr:hypothetical protein Kisp02_47330 [Kineosporia sp. NBRC 101731]
MVDLLLDDLESDEVELVDLLSDEVDDDDEEPDESELVDEAAGVVVLVFEPRESLR